MPTREDPPTRPDGAPHRAPANPVQRSPRGPGTPPPTEADDHLKLPHERDESTRNTAPGPDPRIHQAQKDLESGQVDTDMRTPPGLDAGQRARYVPGAGGEHPSQKTGAP